MRIRDRFVCVSSAAMILICAAAGSYAQNASTSGMVPKSRRKAPVDITTVRPFSVDTILSVKPPKLSAGAGARLLTGPIADAATTTGTGGNISGLVTVPTFVGAFAAENGPSAGTVFPFIMMGNDPLVGGTTTLPARVTEVSWTLLNADGSTFMTVPFSKTFDGIMTHSPNYAKFLYDSSSVPTQFADSVQRAEFFHTAKSSWHTELGAPTIVNHATLTVPYYVNVELSDGTIVQARSYFTGTASDGNTFVLMLDLLFNFFYDNQVVTDINAGNFTTGALNQDWFPNTYLFSINTSNPNAPGGCCTLGFHTYFVDGSIPQSRWVTLFASYISPGLFGAGFQDVTTMSHEISESFNDPFLSNATPNWQFPGQPSSSTACQSNLETGDPVEVLADATVSITLPEGKSSFTFHPQTEALLQWFEMGGSSNAVDGAFSYPNESVLTQSAIPCP